MSPEERQNIIDSLVGFVIRAASEKATSKEVQALPEIASLLLSLPDDDRTLVTVSLDGDRIAEMLLHSAEENKIQSGKTVVISPVNQMEAAVLEAIEGNRQTHLGKTCPTRGNAPEGED